MNALLSEWYTPASNERLEELMVSLRANLETFDLVVLFAESTSGLERVDQSKVTIVRLDVRPSFSDIVHYCNEKLAGYQCFISNNDISFPSQGKLPNASPNQLIVVTRHEVVNDEVIWYDEANYYDNKTGRDVSHKFSSDTWVFKAPIRIKGGKRIHMGQMGCDQRFLWLAYMSGVKLQHATRNVVAIHNHADARRNWNSQDRAALPGILLDENQEITFYYGWKSALLLEKAHGLAEAIMTYTFLLREFRSLLIHGKFSKRLEKT